MAGKRPETLETAFIAIEILRRIPRKGQISATELHAQLKAAGLDRDRRTVQRQLEMLCEHFEIERNDIGKPYGYRWLENAKGLSLPNLSPQESLLLGLAEQHLKNLLPARVMKTMAGFFDQARKNLMPGDGRNAARLERQWLKKVRAIGQTQPLLPPDIKPQVFEAVSEALYGNRWLNVDYRNIEGKQNKYDVMPLGLAQQGQVLYLVCRFRGYDNERNLALHRIRAAKVSTIPFERPQFDLEKYNADGRFAIGSGRLIRLHFRAVPWLAQILDETKLSKDQTITQLEDGHAQI
ncbi:MAG: WYL domain-containing protein, partial [Candidatus Accumulibacter sp.]|nr:WYL domain-containing protein [Accumulibacter sp.]